MKTFDELVGKYGLKRARECAEIRNPNEPIPGTRRRTKIWSRICPRCRTFDISGGKYIGCKCGGVEKQTKLRDFKPHFNLGLGCYVESKQDEIDVMKKKGLRRAV